MKYILTKASNDEFIEIVNYDLEQINALAFSKAIIIRPNFWFGNFNLQEYLNKSQELCDIISQIPLEIMIYDDYIE